MTMVVMIIMNFAVFESGGTDMNIINISAGASNNNDGGSNNNDNNEDKDKNTDNDNKTIEIITTMQ